jgi:hypothetical protein
LSFSDPSAMKMYFSPTGKTNVPGEQNVFSASRPTHGLLAPGDTGLRALPAKSPNKTPVKTDRRAVRRASSRNGGAPGGRALPGNGSVGRFVRRSKVICCIHIANRLARALWMSFGRSNAGAVAGRSALSWR